MTTPADLATSGTPATAHHDSEAAPTVPGPGAIQNTPAAQTTDAIDNLLGPDASSAVTSLRERRPVTRDNLQASHDALFRGGTDAATLHERLVVAVFTAVLHSDRSAADAYATRLRTGADGGLGADTSVVAAVRAAADRARTTGPYGTFTSPALAGYDQPGPDFAVDAELRDIIGTRLATALEYTHVLVLHPRDASPTRLHALRDAGWSVDGIVTLSQLVAFLSCQLRVVAGLAVLAGSPRTLDVPAADPARIAGPAGVTDPTDSTNSTDPAHTTAPAHTTGPAHVAEPAHVADPDSTANSTTSLSSDAAVARTNDPATVTGTPAASLSPASTARRRDGVVDDAHRPAVFTSAQLEWEPWLDDVAEADLTDVQRDALIDAGRAKSPYFRLLARDPGILKARTLADKDIFHNANDGLPRAERELSAAAVSRVNGCLFCASVHSRFAAHYSKRPGDVQRLLDEGVAGEQEPRWRALIDAAAALTRTPVAFTASRVAALRAAGLSADEISDAVHAAAFFAWANRLMLALGEPRIP